MVDELHVCMERIPLVKLLALQQLLINSSAPDHLQKMDQCSIPLKSARIEQGGRFRIDHFYLEAIDYTVQGIKETVKDEIDDVLEDMRAKGMEPDEY